MNERSSKQRPSIIIPYNFDPRIYQLPFWAAAKTYRFLALVWARRHGKDLTCWNYAIDRASREPLDVTYVYPTSEMAKNNLWEAKTNDGRLFTDYIPMALRKRRNTTDDGLNDTDKSVTLLNNSIIRLASGDRPDRLRGGNSKLYVLSEYPEMDPEVLDVIEPIVEANGGQIIVNFTPKGDNHAKGSWEAWQEDPAWFTQLIRADQTGVFTADQLERLKKRIIERFRLQGRSEVEAISYFMQEYFCFKPETEIMTDKGLRKIADIEVGENVISHTGRLRPVTARTEREYDGELVSIRTYGTYEALELTPEHPVRVLLPKKQTYKWVEAKNVKTGDYLVLPRLKRAKPIISEALARLIAWYITEGSTGKNYTQFTLNSDEVDYAKDIIEAAKECNYEAYIENHPTGMNVRINSARLCDFFLAECGTLARNKKIPLFLTIGHERIIYDILMQGDGCKARTKKETWDSYTTISKTLAYQVQMISNTLGLKAGISFRSRAKASHTIQGRTVDVCDSYSVQVRQPNHGTKIVPSKHGTGVYVRTASRVQYKGSVYNLSVKYDESYIAAGRIVHNCSFDTPVIGSYYGEAFRIAEEQGRIGIVQPESDLRVDTYWDLGMDDSTSIIFVQRHNREVRVIDYYESSGEGLAHYAQVLQNKGYVYGEHWAPHDIRVREMGTGVSRIETAKKLGINFQVAPKMSLEDGINAGRILLARCWFDKERTKRLVQALRNYHKDWDDKLKVFRSKPQHNWSSHGADAYRTLATSIREKMADSYFPTNDIPRDAQTFGIGVPSGIIQADSHNPFGRPVNPLYQDEQLFDQYGRLR